MSPTATAKTLILRKIRAFAGIFEATIAKRF